MKSLNILFFFIVINNISYLQTIKIKNLEISSYDLLYSKVEIDQYLKNHIEWRLPTIDELQLIYDNKNALGQFTLAKKLYLALGSYNNLIRPNLNIKYGNSGNSGLWALDFSNGIWYTPEYSSILNMRLVKTDKMPITQTLQTKISTSENSPTKTTGCIKGECYNGYGEFLASNGLKYKGYFQNGKRQGIGFQEYQNGDSYNGEWLFNTQHGKGVYLYLNGDKYEGDWENGQKWGYGIKTFHNGDKYDGNWQEDKKSGSGIYVWANGDYYDGDWSQNEYSGIGLLKLITGWSYYGSWQNGLKSGQGTCVFTSGDKYVGEWKNDNMSGYGKYIYLNGNVIEGLFENGQFIKSSAQIEAERIAQIENENKLKIEAQQNELARREKSIEDLKKIILIQPESPTSSKPTSNSQSNTGTSNSTKALCYNCNKEFDFRVFNPNGGYSNVKDSKKGYVKCSNCDYGNHWTGSYLHNYKDPILEKCYVGTCKNGWIQCGVCHGTGY